MHGLSRYAGALWAFSVWVVITPWVSFIQIVDPATWFAAMGFILAGGAFIYDALTIWPNKGQYVGLTPTIIFIIFGASNILFGGMILNGNLNPYVGTSDLMAFASVTLGLGVASLFITGTYEIYAARHAVKELKAKLNIH